MPRPWWTAGWATSPPIAWTSASSRGPRPFKNHSKSTASAWPRACGPLRARPVHGQVALAQEPPVEPLDRFRGLFFRRHLDEAEPARPARELVGDDPHGLHGPRLRKQLAQVFFRRLEGKIADEQLCRHLANLLPSLKAARYGTPASARGKDNDRRQRMSRSLLGRITLGGLRALDASGVDAARR